jgi:hypothetical protein
MHSCLDKSSPWVELEFIHLDGQVHKFYSMVNILTNERLTGFDFAPPSIGHSIAEVKKIIIKIRLNCKVLKYFGTIKI